MQIYLNNTPCQYVKSKTNEALNHIKKLIASAGEINTVPEIKHITIIITNNNLLEGIQWSIRVDNIKKNVYTISCKSPYKSVDNLMGYYSDLQLEDKNKVADVILMCNNKKRNQDLLKIIKRYNTGSYSLHHLGINKIEFTVMFDEADNNVNLNLMCKSIQSLYKMNNILSVHLITATPFDNFWKKLKKNNITTELRNLKYNITNINSSIEDINQYRKISDHNKHFVEDDTDGVEYIKRIYETKIVKEKEPYRIFAPPDRLTNSHEEIKHYFLEKKFIVVILNGKEKMIYFNSESCITIKSFNIKSFEECSENQEMFKTLGQLNILYPNRNIVITGFNCVQRGVTFQSTNFNFTDFIIPYIKDPATKVQLAGRANGKKIYVDTHRIYMSKKSYNEIIKYIEYQLNIQKSNPEIIKMYNFTEKTENEKDNPRWTIPIKYNLTNEEYEYYTEKKGNTTRFYNDRIDELCSKHNINVDGYKKCEWRICKNDDTYNKNIGNLLKSIMNKEKTCLIHKKDKEKNIKLYSLYFDYKNENVILLKYNGDIKRDE
jgi:hypothetical protein